MPDIQSQIAQHGALVNIKVGDTLIGYGRTSNLRINYGTEGLYALGSVGPTEHAQLRWTATITMDEFVIHRGKLGQATQLLNLAPAAPDDVLKNGLLDFYIVDDQDQAMVSLYRCTIGDFALTVTANQFSGQNATFFALDAAFPTSTDQFEVGQLGQK